MDWLQVLTLIGSNFAFILTLWLWNRSESRDDHRNLENKVFMVVASIQEEVKAIRQDMKDFHGRLERQDAEFKAGLLILEEKIKCNPKI